VSSRARFSCRHQESWAALTLMLQTLRRAQVLIVDDSADTVLLLQRLLARHGLDHLHVATDPRTVIDHLPELNPDVVLLDLYMPYVDGYTMLRHIRECAGQQDLPVVVLTGDVSPETLLRAVNDGATAFLTKPFNATEILIRGPEPAPHPVPIPGREGPGGQGADREGTWL
jgi:CheY-like chemotaxis protein